jgi:uncharacterized repeat protein (TIGR03847 family)
MPSSQHEFESVFNIHADAMGEPGQRYFRLLIDSNEGHAVLWLEKPQLYRLAVSIQQLLAMAEPNSLPKFDLANGVKIVQSLDMLAAKLSALLESDIPDQTAWLTIAEVAEEADTIRQMLAMAQSEGVSLSTLDPDNVISIIQSLEVIVADLSSLLDHNDMTTGSVNIEDEPLRMNIADVVEETEALLRILDIVSPQQSSPSTSEVPLTQQSIGNTHIEFQAVDLALGYDSGEDIFNLTAYENPDEEDSDRADFRCWVSRKQIKDLANESLEVCAAGRPLCPLCSEPMGQDTHACPKQNGHRLG